MCDNFHAYQRNFWFTRCNKPGTIRGHFIPNSSPVSSTIKNKAVPNYTGTALFLDYGHNRYIQIYGL